MTEFGRKIGSLLCGGEIIELIGDVGAGKTTLTKGIASGFDVNETVQSPSFTISRVYKGRGGIDFAHYDFYRLDNAGIMAEELRELLASDAIKVIEWANVVSDILPADRLSININATSEESRQIEIISGGEKSKNIERQLQ